MSRSEVLLTITQLAQLVPLSRVLVLVDDDTDQYFLRATLDRARTGIDPATPDAGGPLRLLRSPGGRIDTATVVGQLATAGGRPWPRRAGRLNRSRPGAVSCVSSANPTEERTTLTTGTDLQYSTSGLRTGAAGLREVVGQSEAARAALQGAPLEPGVFGLTAAGAVYAAVLESVRTARGRGLDQEGQRAGDLSGRSDAAGGMGDELTVRTEQTASTGAPR